MSFSGIVRKGSNTLTKDVKNMSQKNILISGSTGYIATNFIKQFSGKYNFVLLSHKKTPGHITLEGLYSNVILANSIDIIINLAGANIGDKRWSQKRKDELLHSRILTIQKIVNLFNSLNKKPFLVSASAIGIYPEKLINDESTVIEYQNYNNFSEEITKKWEESAKQYLGPMVITRFGVVFGGKGGAFPKILKPFLFYAGSILADGSQYMPWIALPDLLKAIDHVISKQKTGIYNFVAPEMINNLQLTNLIAKTWGKPVVFKMPAFLIKILFGQMGKELFLSNIRASPTRLLNDNFVFMYPNLQDTLIAIKNKVF